MFEVLRETSVAKRLDYIGFANSCSPGVPWVIDPMCRDYFTLLPPEHCLIVKYQVFNWIETGDLWFITPIRYRRAIYGFLINYSDSVFLTDIY